MPELPKVLAVDDLPQNLYLLERLLARLNVQLHQAKNGPDALALALENDFCVAIIDVQMPEMDGYELVELLRGNESTAALPVIFVSAIFSDEYHHRRGYDAGAVDFMSKPFNPDILRSKVQVFIDLYNKRRSIQDTAEQLNAANAVLSRRTLQLETSNQIGRQINSLLELEKLLPEIVSLIQVRFDYSFVGLWLLNDAEDSLNLVGASGAAISAAPASAGGPVDPGESIPLAHPDDPVASVCRDGDHSAVLPLARGGSRLCQPLSMGQRQLGVLDLRSQLADGFPPEDLIILQLLADQIAVAIRNASLFSEVLRFKNHLEDLVAKRTAELQRAYQSLAKMDQNKSEFITVAAHELRTPLTLISGYAEMLHGMTEAPEARMMIEGILKGQERLLEVVNSMLDVSRIDSELLKAYKEPLNLTMLIERAAASFKDDLAERKIRLTTQLTGLPVIQADAELIHKLFQHLVMNAIKYTPDGGSITIHGHAQAQVFDPTDSGALPAPAVEITIADTGIGIDPEYHQLIFDKFYQVGSSRFHSTGRTKFKGGGPGLGLAIARGIVKVHGGQIWVESPGCDEQTLPGSVFHVLLPLN